MAIAINSNFERDQYVASFTGQTLFAYSFPIFSETYLTVFKYAAGDVPDDRIQQLTLGADYSVQGVGQAEGGTITLTVGATIGDVVTVMGTEPIERESVFQDLNPFTVALNQQLNEQTVMQQQTYTYWNHFTPRYNADELISNEVRPQKRILPMLPNGHVWVGRGEYGDDPDDIVTQFVGGAGSGNVVSTGTPMRKSLAVWTGVNTNITDSYLDINGTLFTKTADTTQEVAGFADEWGAMHWPAHTTGGRPASPSNGDTYYDTSLNQFFGYVNGVWTPFNASPSAGSIQKTVEQIAHGLVKGRILRMDVNTALYVYAQANTAENAEVAGFCSQVIDDDNFVLQPVGFTEEGMMEDFEPLVPGRMYFLSGDIPGNITLEPPTAEGYVNLPVFLADTTTTGQIRQSRGFLTEETPTPPVTPPVVNVPVVTTYASIGSGWETVFCATITPSTIAKRVWVLADVAAGAAGSGNPVYFRITRNGSPIYVGDAAGSRLQASGAVGHHFAGNPTNWWGNYIDSPASIEPVIYCVQMISPSGSISYVNRTTTDSNSTLFGRSSSSITLVEVD